MVAARDALRATGIVVMIGLMLVARTEVNVLHDSVLLGALSRHYELHSRQRSKVIDVVVANGSSQELRELLTEAVTETRRDLAESLHRHGEDPEASRSLLFTACAHRSAPLVEALLWAGANASLGRVDEGTTPLHLAAGWLHSRPIVELILASRHRDVIGSVMAKPSAGGLRGHSPIFWARYYGHHQTSERLIAWMRDAGWLYSSNDDGFVQEHHSRVEAERGPTMSTAWSRIRLILHSLSVPWHTRIARFLARIL